jgi:hypothetical protein
LCDKEQKDEFTKYILMAVKGTGAKRDIQVNL